MKTNKVNKDFYLIRKTGLVMDINVKYHDEILEEILYFKSEIINFFTNHDEHRLNGFSLTYNRLIDVMKNEWRRVIIKIFKTKEKILNIVNEMLIHVHNEFDYDDEILDELYNKCFIFLVNYHLVYYYDNGDYENGKYKLSCKTLCDSLYVDELKQLYDDMLNYINQRKQIMIFRKLK